MAETYPIPTHACFQDLTGRRFGRLIVLEYAGKRQTNHRWLCECDCGKRTTVESGHLRSGVTKSCGCLQKEKVTRHGKCKTPEYKVWDNMISRCTSPTYIGYANYGDRGITVCERWRNSFAAFLKDMGLRPSPNHSIDRVNNEGNYEKANCRWATRRQQQRNRRRNRLLTFKGKTMCLAEWAERINMPYFTLHGRLRLGWSVERALLTPAK